ncbi:MAG: hypothetical protein PHW87_07780 [Methanothrix sp.]|nr:hypothetical protein [Methanothrix sp.]
MPGKTAHLDNGAAWPERPCPQAAARTRAPQHAALRLPGTA